MTRPPAPPGSSLNIGRGEREGEKGAKEGGGGMTKRRGEEEEKGRMKRGGKRKERGEMLRRGKREKRRGRKCKREE